MRIYTSTIKSTHTTGGHTRTVLRVTYHATPGPALRHLRRTLRATLQRADAVAEMALPDWFGGRDGYDTAIRSLRRGGQVRLTRHQGTRRLTMTATTRRPFSARQGDYRALS
ncbi:hypothetical protein ACFWXO_13530 [Kitasatospora sp. NPDC059088]|uniref:hypothetical protein n=1 Tax=Kitasatospora sp. NPDC059088 TaxID=3346722 RepID=UPI0036B47335